MNKVDFFLVHWILLDQLLDISIIDLTIMQLRLKIWDSWCLSLLRSNLILWYCQLTQRARLRTLGRVGWLRSFLVYVSSYLLMLLSSSYFYIWFSAFFVWSSVKSCIFGRSMFQLAHLNIAWCGAVVSELMETPLRLVFLWKILYALRLWH